VCVNDDFLILTDGRNMVMHAPDRTGFMPDEDQGYPDRAW